MYLGHFTRKPTLTDVNPFPYITYLQQTTLKISNQNMGTLYKRKTNTENNSIFPFCHNVLECRLLQRREASECVCMLDNR